MLSNFKDDNIKKKDKSQRNGSLVRSKYHSCRGPKFPDKISPHYTTLRPFLVTPLFVPITVILPRVIAKYLLKYKILYKK